jgi:hypothetical protein
MQQRMQAWVQGELASVDVGDQRRNHRFRVLVQQCSVNPQATFNGVCPTKADKKAAYRFIANEKIDPVAMREAHHDSTWRRASSYGRVLVLQDTTSMDFTRHHTTEGLGHLDSQYARGFLVHSALAATQDGEPLGVVHQEIWVRQEEDLGKSHERRKRPWQDKESFKWQQTVETVQKGLPAAIECIVVGDRESDVYGLLASARPKHIQLLVRSAQDRVVVHNERRLHNALRQAPVAGTMVVDVARARNREPRQAVCDVRYEQFTLAPPRNADPGVPKVPVTVWATSVTERHPPRGELAVHWILLATWPVESFDEAVECAQLYSRRWLVERYHFVLKSGCRIEQAELRTQERLERLLAIYCIVAWRLLAMTYRARSNATSCCELLFAPLEWRLLYAHEHGGAHAPENADAPTLQQAVLWTAKLGGYWARKSDRPPGVKVLWRGLIRLHDMVLGFSLAASLPPNGSCG